MKKKYIIHKRFLIIILLLFIFSACLYRYRKYSSLSDSPEDYEIISRIEKIKEKTGENINILIDKSEYKLTVLIGTDEIKSYDVVFGKNPIDDKRMEGDNCTPEGQFKIRAKYAHRKWSRFLWIDYPTEHSYKKHNKAKKDGEIPNDAKIGGEIGIHGCYPGTSYLVDQKINWTQGCICLRNDDIRELFYIVDKGTSILVIK